MSRPAQKQSPAPDSSTARAEGSPPSDRAADTRPWNISPSMAFFFSGRFMRTWATPPSRSIRTRSATVPPPSGLRFGGLAGSNIARLRALVDPELPHGRAAPGPP
jgi:hypothetical protein